MASISRAVRLRLSEDEIRAIAKPRTQWEQIAVSSNEEVFRIDRLRGQGFLFIAAVASVVLIRNLFTLPLSSNFTILCSIITLVSTVCGVFFRSRGNTDRILELRNEVKKNIEKSPLAAIRSSYPDPNVVSNQELNDWARYFLHERPFEEFLDSQWSSIFDFELDEENKKLIKQKYFYRIFHPEKPSNLELSNNVLSSRLFTEAERVPIRQFQMAIRQLKITSVSDACQKYTSFLKAGGIKTLTPDQLPIYAWLFTIYIWNEKTKIAQLKISHAEELRAFSPHFKLPLEQYLADRDVSLDYKEFEQKNGEGAIHLISGLTPLLRFILYQNLGLVEVKKKFQNDIDRLSAEAQVEEAVLKHEGMNIRSYAEFRARNGKEAILRVTSVDIKRKLVEKFLELPAGELADTTTYQKEIDALGVPRDKIKIKLSRIWFGMTFRKILTLEKTVQESIFKYSNSAEGKTKAKEEIRNLPVAEVFDIYQPLFDVGILELSDYDFTNKLADLPRDECISLIEKHTETISKVGWLHKDNPKVYPVVFYFINQNKLVFLNQMDLPKEGLWPILDRFDLVPEPLKELRTTTKQSVATEAREHEQKIQLLYEQHEEEERKIIRTVRIQQVTLEGQNSECKQKFEEAEKKFTAKKTERADFERAFKKWEEEVEKQEELLTSKRASLDEKRLKKIELDKMPERFKFVEARHKTHQVRLRDLEEPLKMENEKNPTVLLLRSQKKTLDDRLVAINKEREKLKADLAKASVTPGEVKDKASETRTKASEPSTSRAEPRTEESSSREGISERLSQIEKEIAEKKRLREECWEEIQKKAEAIEKAIVDFSKNEAYQKQFARVTKWSNKFKEDTEKKAELEKACLGLESLAEEVLEQGKDIQSIPSVRKDKQTSLRELLREEAAFEFAKTNTEGAYKKTQEKLDEMKRTLSASLMEQEQKRYGAEIEKENTRSKAVNAEIKKKAEAQLREFMPRSVSH